MTRRAATLALLALGAGLAVLGLRAEGRAPEPKAPSEAAPIVSASSSDLFPLVPGDRHVRTFQCTGFLRGKMFLGFGSAERLGPEEYVVLEIRQQAYESSVTQTFGREWLRSDENGVVCGQREEGSVTTLLEPPQRVLDLPLTVGKRWTWRGTAGGLACESESTAVVREKVALPIGTLEDCWRVDTVMRGRPGDKLERSVWFAPGLGIVQESSRIESQGRAIDLLTKLERISEPEAPQTGGKPRRRS